MKTTTILIAGLLALTTLAGCLDEDDGAPAPTPQPDATVGPEPSFNNTQPASVTGLEFVAQLAFDDGTPYPSGSGIWVFGDTVYGSSLGAGFFIADVSDPEHPVLLYNATTDAANPEANTITSFARDADLVAHDDGRKTLLLATQTDGMHVWDVTNPEAPLFQSQVAVDPNHNVAVVPGTPLVFNSQSGGEGRTNDLVDVSDPRNPVVLGTYGAYGCHDITFWGELGSTFRAYCAGIDRTEIWNLDGLDPDAADFGITLQSIVEGVQDSPVVGNPAFASAPLRTLHHFASVNEDATVLMIGDEQNGGGEPGGCFFYDELTGQSTPFGALWFYDLSDETAPELVSWISPPRVDPDPEGTDPDPTNPAGAPNEAADSVPNCTAHFGTLVPGEEKIVMSWYSAGVVLIDFSDLANPVILDQYQPDPTNPWDARVHGGYVFTGDIVRGMDVLRLV